MIGSSCSKGRRCPAIYANGTRSRSSATPWTQNENLIKRIIGKPGEQIALVDGDVFVRSDAVPEDATNSLDDLGRTGLVDRAQARARAARGLAALSSTRHRLPRIWARPRSVALQTEAKTGRSSGTTLSRKPFRGRSPQLSLGQHGRGISEIRLAYNDHRPVPRSSIRSRARQGVAPAQLPGIRSCDLNRVSSRPAKSDELTIELTTRQTVFQAPSLQGNDRHAHVTRFALLHRGVRLGHELASRQSCQVTPIKTGPGLAC